eukprot:3256060-Ditylum_brightwellii.AAC.1
MNGMWDPPIPYSHLFNPDHISMYRDDTSSYLWDVKNSSRKQIATGGAEKDRGQIQKKELHKGEEVLHMK